MAEPAAVLTLASTAFSNGGEIPAKFTCDGEDISPALSWTGVPVGTQSFALLVDDPDVPKQLKADGTFDHWTLFNIPADMTSIPEGDTAGTAGANGAGRNEFMGSCPPRQYEPAEHRYFFRLYALDTTLDLPEGATKNEVLAAMEGHILQEAELMGRYHRP
jgi:Raf kinase inhibitor-like YbhB/YbcL family protein